MKHPRWEWNCNRRLKTGVKTKIVNFMTLTVTEDRKLPHRLFWSTMHLQQSALVALHIICRS